LKDWGYNMDKIRIMTVYKEEEIFDHAMGYSKKYCTKEIIGYEVSGGMFSSKFHKTLKAAEKTMQERIEYRKKYPHIFCYSKRDFEYLEKHNLPIPENCLGLVDSPAVRKWVQSKVDEIRKELKA